MRRTRYTPRPLFGLQIVGENRVTLCLGVASEWWLFRVLRKIGRERAEVAWFECAGHPLTDESLAGLNCYLRTNSIRHFKSRRWADGNELLGWGEWARFCRLLGLKFHGKGTNLARKPSRRDLRAFLESRQKERVWICAR